MTGNRKEASLASLPSCDRLRLESLVSRYQDYGKLVSSVKSKQDELKDEHIEPLRLKLGLDVISGKTFEIIRQPGRETLDQSLLIRQMLDMGLAVRKTVGRDSRFVELTAEEIVAMVHNAKKPGEPYTEIKRVGKRG